MTSFRAFALTVGGLAILVASARGQGSIDLKPYRLNPEPMPGDALSKMLDLRSGKVRTTGPALEANKKLFRNVAEWHVYAATFEPYYAVQDTGELKPKSTDPKLNFDSFLSDFASLILVPAVDTKPVFTPDQADYINYFGSALDAAFRQVWAKNPPSVIRVSSGRMFVLAARSGAPSFAKTITELLKNQHYKAKDGKPVETPADLLLYAIKAAESLLAAYDPLATNRPEPSNHRHTVPEAELVALIQVLDDFVVKGPPVADKAALLNPDQPAKPLAIEVEPKSPMPKDPVAPTPANKLEPKGLSPEQIALVRYYRRQAVRALAKVRFDSIGGEGIPRVRPAFTLARVAVRDAAISPAPNASEIAEAVIGLCGMFPTRDLKIEEMGVAIATGVSLLVRFNADDRSRILDNPQSKMLVPWKLTAARLSVAIAGLKRGTQTNGRLRGAAAMVNALCDSVLADLVMPLESETTGSAQPGTERIGRWIEQYLPKDGSRSLFEDDPKFKLNPSQVGN